VFSSHTNAPSECRRHLQEKAVSSEQAISDQDAHAVRSVSWKAASLPIKLSELKFASIFQEAVEAVDEILCSVAIDWSKSFLDLLYS
jgi:hypothetical protein